MKPWSNKCYARWNIPNSLFITPAQKKKGDGEGDSDDEYDYDDPFLNDESSDDYAPTDSDSDSPLEDAEEEDNTSRMLKEAKKFIRKRRWRWGGYFYLFL